MVRFSRSVVVFQKTPLPPRYTKEKERPTGRLGGKGKGKINPGELVEDLLKIKILKQQLQEQREKTAEKEEKEQWEATPPQPKAMSVKCKKKALGLKPKPMPKPPRSLLVAKSRPPVPLIVIN